MEKHHEKENDEQNNSSSKPRGLGFRSAGSNASVPALSTHPVDRARRAAKPEKALERLLNALAMPDYTEVQKVARLAALEDSLPTAEGDAFCMAVEAGNILEVIKALGETPDFPELAKRKTALQAVCTAYWEVTEGAGPSWWHQ